MYGTDGQNLYTVDTTTGQAALIGPHGAVSFAIGALAFDNSGRLFGIDLTSLAQLYEIDPATGAANPIGPIDLGILFEGALAFVGDTLYGADQGSSAKAFTFTIDTATGAGSLIGSGEARDINDMTYDGVTLYATDGLGNTFGAIDPETGGYSAIGDPGVDVGDIGGLAADPSDGAVYASFEDGGFYLVDTDTGAARLIGDTVANYGLAFAPIVSPACDLDGDGAFRTRDSLLFHRRCKDGSGSWDCDLNDDGRWSLFDTLLFNASCAE